MKIKKITAFIILLTFLTVNVGVGRAQAVAEDVVVSETMPEQIVTEVPALSSALPSPDGSQDGIITPGTGNTEATSEVLVQDTSVTQETIPGSSLENTTYPTLVESTTTEIVILKDSTEATTTSEVIFESSPAATSTPEVVIENAHPEVVTTLALETASTEISQSSKAQANLIQIIPQEELKPKKEFTFAIAGSAIASKKKPSWQGEDSERERTVSESPNITIDALESSLKVSGSCKKTYFVVLLYKKVEDYDKDPASYVLNRAYPCVGGLYSYSIRELPPALADETYYLLIGQQGETGSWEPITNITPINIARLGN